MISYQFKIICIDFICVPKAFQVFLTALVRHNNSAVAVLIEFDYKYHVLLGIVYVIIHPHNDSYFGMEFDKFHYIFMRFDFDIQYSFHHY